MPVGRNVIHRIAVGGACFAMFLWQGQDPTRCLEGPRGDSVGTNDPINATTCDPCCLIPDRCESPIRGRFDKIYETGFWNVPLRRAADFYGGAAWPPPDARSKSSSGKGSDLGYPTETSLRIVRHAIALYNVTSMVDIPCGDANWIFDSLATDTLPIYVGLDITGAVIKLNQQRFAHHRNKRFEFWDATACALPKYRDDAGGEARAFDLIHVRDVVQHMSLDMGVSFFCNVFRAGPRVLVTTTYDKVQANKNIKEGSWYENNLWLEPFSFPKIECTPTHPKHEKDLTCIYDLSEDWVREFMSSKCVG